MHPNNYLTLQVENPPPIILSSSFELPTIPFQLKYEIFLKKPFLIGAPQNHIKHFLGADNEKQP